MEELTTQFGSVAAMLVGLVGVVVQQFKRAPAMENLQKKIPVYQGLSLGLGILGAFQFGIPNPIFAGLFIGLGAMGAFDTVKKIPVPSVKTIAPIILILVFLAAGCSQTLKPAAWLLAGTNAQDLDTADIEYIGRLGLQSDQTEFGLASNWWQAGNQSYGVYALQFLPADPNGLLGTPYLGLSATVDVARENGGLYGFITGTILNIGGIDVVTEFTARTYNEDIKERMPESENKYRIFAGSRLRF